MERGLATLSTIPPDRLLHLCYEDFLEEPEKMVTRMIEFVGPEYADTGWVNRCVARISTPTSSWARLPAEEQEQLDAACRRGFGALARHGVVRLSGRPLETT